MRLPHASRRAVCASFVSLLGYAPPQPAVAAGSCSVAGLEATRQQLAAAEALLPTPARWSEASKILDAIDLDAMAAALDSCVDPKSFKEQAMNNAAFIVYYEEARYGDLRLEPQTPSARAEQNGRKKEFLRALADEKAELSFLLKEQDDDAELRAYAATARKALTDFLALLPKSAAP